MDSVSLEIVDEQQGIEGRHMTVVVDVQRCSLVLPRGALGQKRGNRMVAHNSFLSVLTETGIIGFSLFSVLLGMLGFYVYRLPELERRFWTVTLATWTIGVSTLTWEHRKPTWLLFGLILVRGADGWRGPASRRGAAPAELQDQYAPPEMAC